MSGSGRVRVYIGTTPSTLIAAKVLECSIIRRTEMQVDFVHMLGKEWEYDDAKLPSDCDEYALRRWMIPAHAGYSGLAVYIDAASLVTGDIWDLWTMPYQSGTAGRRTMYCPHVGGKPDTRVMLIDCGRAKGQWPFDIETLTQKLGKRRYSLDAIQQGIYLSDEPCQLPASWLCRDYFQPGKSRLVHYANEPDLPYPWHTGEHPYGQPWEMELSIAMHTGFVPAEVLTEYVNLWGTGDPRALHPEYGRFIPVKRGGKGAGSGKTRGGKQKVA